MPKTLTTKELKTIQLMELLNEIKSPYDQIEIITNLLKEIRIRDQKRFISDRYLDIFESELDKIIESLEDEIIYFDPTPN
jgi:HEPN domain-containing protein